MILPLRRKLESTDFDLKALKQSWFHQPLNVVHCGAHLAQEATEYQNLGFMSVLWIEASSQFAHEASEIVKEFLNQKVIQAALWNLSGVHLDLKIASNGASSSIRGFAEHAALFPEIEMIGVERVVTATLDDVLADVHGGGLLVLDLQGVELQVLQGAEASLEKFQFVICEVSTREIYSDQNNWEEVSDELVRSGFSLVDWTFDPIFGYGNALYSRNTKHVMLFRTLRRAITLFNALSFSVQRRFFLGKENPRKNRLP